MSAVQLKREYDRTSHIMIVDDDPSLLKFFKIHLNKFFSRVLVVKSAKEAIDAIKEKDIDLILSDLRMPKTDGLQLLKKIRSADASIPVYLISGALVTDEQMKLIEETADGFLRKPFGIDEIQNFIENGIRRRDILRQLALCIPENQKLLKVLKGKDSVENCTTTENRDEAKKLISELSA